jgi:hypothetical protein
MVDSVIKGFALQPLTSLPNPNLSSDIVKKKSTVGVRIPLLVSTFTSFHVPNRLLLDCSVAVLMEQQLEIAILIRFSYKIRLCFGQT